ncbi:hypothetical protein GYMLUDRAFT_218556 [Collybiopsis luxurians FD-317 M1]|nr:hypothetical protein GYMLUDRAFT_218556 [Collybiopsis luxurians FD-317 M1]
MASNVATSFELFPEPSLLAPPKAPPRLPGGNLQTTEALLEVLKDNHEQWHIFFDDDGRHNHITHQVLAIWAFGAHQDLIRGSYKKNIALQRPKPEIREAITASNFIEHLGDKTYYSAYLAFFDQVVREQKGNPSFLMEEYVFSNQVNFGRKSQQGEHPQMTCRFLELIMHSLIHFGYGVEFGLPGMMSEGLAQAAVHPLLGASLIPESLFNQVLSAPNEGKVKKSPVHAFTVVARILADPQFKIPGTNIREVRPQVIAKSAALLEHINQWTLDVQKQASDPKEIDRKIEELHWTNTILYAVSGYNTDREFNADFVYMHMVTSALFLPILAAHLSPTSQALLLRTCFIVTVSWWIFNGRPNLDIVSFMRAEDAIHNNQRHPSVKGLGSHSLPHPHALSSASPISTNPNPWLQMIQQASVHPDDHFPKILRSLAHFALLYGGRKAGEKDFSQTELAGAEMLDGSLFVRAAGLTAKRLEHTVADQYLTYWDRPGFFEDSKTVSKM